MDTRTHPGVSATDVLLRCAERTRRYDFSIWFWGDGIAVDGLQEAGELAADEASRIHALRFLQNWTEQAPSWTDHLTPGLALVKAFGRDHPSGVRLADWLAIVPHTPDGAALYRPDQPQYRHTVWVDSVYHVPPFLAALGEERRTIEALSAWKTHMDVLRDPRGPFLRHSFDTGTGIGHGYGWGRGSGWAMLGMIDTLRFLEQPPTWAVQDFTELAQAVLSVQDSSGMWRTLLHDREAYLESSATAFFGAAFTAGVAARLLGAEFADAADRAWRAVAGRIDADGSFWGVSACTWAGAYDVDDDQMYRTLPTETNVWGQGSILRFAGERLRAGLEVTR